MKWRLLRITKSTRQAAADLGITSGTVTKARKSAASKEAPETKKAPETVTGRDSKQYPAPGFRTRLFSIL
jgi:hypothetical protein